MSDSAYPKEISVEETKQLLESNTEQVLLIDVREPDEVAICRIADARHIPMRQIPENLDTLPTDRQLLIYCHHGARSMRVTDFLRAKGFPAATNVAGGIDAWAEKIDPAMRRY